MIEGLKFDVTTDELRKHLEAKIEHHRERKDFYDHQAAALQKGNVEAMPYTNGDPVQALQAKGSQHLAKIELFVFLRDHLIPGETYRLEESDLTRLEIVSRAGW